MRKLMCFTAGFGGACILCVLFLWKYMSLPLLAAAIAVCAAIYILSRKIDLLRVPAAILFGFVFGMVWFWLYGMIYIRPIADLDGTTHVMSVTASGYGEQGTYRMSFEGTAQIAEKPYRLRVYLKEDMEIIPGDTLCGEFQLRVTTPEGAKESSYERGNGFFLTATQKGELHQTRPETIPWWCVPAVMEARAKQLLQEYFPENAAAFAKALLLGDTSDLQYAEDTALKISGIRHVTSVSGLHVSFLLGVILFLCRRKRMLSFFIAIPVLGLFAAVTGFSPSVCRACLMALLMLLGTVIKEEYDGLTGLSFACLIMMAVNPYLVNSVGFQLSVTSVLGILLFASPIYEWILKRFPKVKPKTWQGKGLRWLAGSVSVSASAMIFTTPVSAYYFGAVSLAGVFTNLLTIWAIGVLFCGLMLTCMAGLFSLSAGKMAAIFLSGLIRFVEGTASFVADIPFAAVYAQSGFIVLWLYFCYALLLLFLVLRKRGKLIFSMAAGTLCLSILLSVYVPQQDSFRLTVMNVGEGQCILLQSGGKTLLIDCGGDSDTGAADYAAQTILSQGIRKLDAVALTHYDSDHAGAVCNLLSRVSANAIYLPQIEDNGFASMLPNSGDMQKLAVSENRTIPFGDGTLTLFAPDHQKTANENCMCVLFESEECDILITGDRSRSGEKRLIESAVLPDVDVLIAGHHGAKSSTSYDLLEAVTPEVVIISAGEGNSYGHPAAEVLSRLDEFHCTVFRTDQDGTVLVRR